MIKSFNSYIYLPLFLLLLLPLFTNSVQADTHWAPSGNDIYNTNSDEVGIGLTNPAYKLQVQGTNVTTTVGLGPSADGYDANLLFLQGATQKFLIGYDDSPAGFRFHNYATGSVSLFIEESTGEIGIGTTAPGDKLHVSGGDVLVESGRELKVESSGGERIRMGYDSGSGSGYLRAPTKNLELASGWGQDVFLVGGSGGIKFDTQTTALDRTTRMRLTSSGNLGIGTTSPGAALDVRSDSGLYLGAGQDLQLTVSSDDVYFKQATLDKDIYFQVNDGGTTKTALFVDGSDNEVGIGTTNPAALLHIADVYSPGGRNLEVGDDTYFTDIDATGTLGLYSTTDGSGKIKFGSDGATVGSKSGSGAFRVDATLIAKEIYVQSDVWADYVFSENYHLRPLSEVENYISENGHLPDVPSEEQILNGGINVAEMDKTLLQKIEELTLYVIDLKEENDALKARLDNFENVSKE